MSYLGDVRLGDVRLGDVFLSDSDTSRQESITYTAERRFYMRRLRWLLDHLPFSCPRHHTWWTTSHDKIIMENKIGPWQRCVGEH